VRDGNGISLPLKGGGRKSRERFSGGDQFMFRFDRTPQKTAQARRLRVSATPVERILWSRLKSAEIEGQSFRRQHPLGPCILDFYCAAARLCIELECEQHGRARVAARDQRRDRWLQEKGILVLRFSNTDVRGNLSGVLDAIAHHVLERRPQQTPSRRASRSDLPLSGGGKAPFPDQAGDPDA
jgi:very-short-patch-repair endonuclease